MQVLELGSLALKAFKASTTCFSLLGTSSTTCSLREISLKLYSTTQSQRGEAEPQPYTKSTAVKLRWSFLMIVVSQTI